MTVVLKVNAQRVELSNSGLIDSSSYNDADAGSIKINATESVIIDGADTPDFCPHP
jgi:hypothetical protein